jgi:hypothetical protein
MRSPELGIRLVANIDYSQATTINYRVTQRLARGISGGAGLPDEPTRFWDECAR